MTGCRLEMSGNEDNAELQAELDLLLKSVQSGNNTELDRLNYGVYFTAGAIIHYLFMLAEFKLAYRLRHCSSEADMIIKL